MNDDLNFHQHQRREAFARYGLCMYHIQCVERTLSLIIAGTEASNRKLSPSQFVYELDITQNNTFGKLLTLIKEGKTQIDSDIISKLELALKERNRIAHDYWWEKAVSVTKLAGLQEIIEELANLTNFFADLDKVLMVTHQNQYHILGITKEQVELILEEFRKLDSIEFPKERMLNKTEEIVKISKYFLDDKNTKFIPILTFKDESIWTFGDKGLYRINTDLINSDKIKNYEKYQKQIPCEIVTKINLKTPWNYSYKMPNGKLLKVAREPGESFMFSME